MTIAPVQIPSFQTLSKDLGATALRRGLNLWPPFLAASVHVDRISADFREFDVSLRMRPWSRNYVGTQFGGSLFAMCDPWWMLGALRCLGDEYIVWDKAGEIDFVSPGRTDVRTSIRITDELLDEIRAATADGSKYLVWCDNDVVAEDGTLVARYRKQLYVRRKPA
ncbi:MULTISPECIES: DUF4442 domain-containing protein [Janibacter]|uniref:DUF4442 domain-containing protein n=1 Tax=Janibacter TaxID=53457 RepID=UPI0021A4B35C|nr:DUF4442 domain-containing protein [Janibacter hoylei]MCT2291933.1 DUF4442 domain-containing protein [Janibacter hoylei]